MRSMRGNLLLAGGLLALVCPLPLTADTPSAPTGPFLDTLAEELACAMENLKADDGTTPYYLAYTVYDEEQAVIQAALGALTANRHNLERHLNIDLRVGSYELDNTHQLRGQGRSRVSGSGNISLPLSIEKDAIRHALWYHTDRVFKDAVKRLTRVRTNLKVKVEEEDQSNDFSREAPSEYDGSTAKLTLDRDTWAESARRISVIAREFPLIYESGVTVGAYAGTRRMVTSEGTRLKTSQTRHRITLSAGTRAEDGMELSQSHDFNAATPEKLPDEAEIESAFRGVIGQVLALREAPLAEPYIGPAILRNRASAVFFHEILGHRIEGHRQKDVTEGQTFKKKIGERILPEFISVYDDPTLRTFNGIDLRGYYRFDDEGVPAQRVTIVEDGIFRRFLMSRSPLEDFPNSNGHGRRQPGNAIVSRQANLIVESAKQVPFDRLLGMLIEECKKQGKPYGLLFEDISGGFTMTGRQGPQSYKVLPIVVYRVFADGRLDELIRGADIVGTPLTSFEKIIATGDDPAVFNGTCGAESGWVPVSAISPSILVSTIEIEKRQRAQSRPPILPPPAVVEESSVDAPETTGIGAAD